MDFGALPPEVNSDRMYMGPGPATLLAASAGWGALAAELYGVAGGYQAVVTRLTDEFWAGPSSMSMVGALTPYLQWIRTAAVQCEEAATRAVAAAAAYETAFAMTVPPPAIAANRVRLATLIATNFLGQNAPAIGVAEAEYSEMWVQDAAAMYNYAASSSAASAFEVFVSPPVVAQAGAVTVCKMQAVSARLISSVPQALQSLATPGGTSAASDPGAGGLGFDTHGPSLDFEGALPDVGGGAVTGLGHADSLGMLSVPPSWADALSVEPPAPVLDANVMPGGWGAKPSGTAAGRVGRESVRRIGLRPKVISRSSVAG